MQTSPAPLSWGWGRASLQGCKSQANSDLEWDKKGGGGVLDAGVDCPGSLHVQESVTDDLVELDIRLQGVALGQVFPCGEGVQMCDQGKSWNKGVSSSWRTLGLRSLLVICETQQSGPPGSPCTASVIRKMRTRPQQEDAIPEEVVAPWCLAAL